jgi:hypothetical protein
LGDSTFLFVDDRPDTLTTTYGTVGADRIRIEDPTSVKRADIEWATVVLCDYNIDATLPKPDSEAGQFANIPRTGAALVAAIRSLEEGDDPEKAAAPFRAYALLSADLQLIGRLALPPDYLAHVGANSLGVEWIFQKPRNREERVQFGEQLESLGRAVSRVREVWNQANDQVRELRTLLKIPPDLNWSERAWNEVVEAHPRLRDPAERIALRPVFRWLLQEALPFPAVLLDSAYLAGRLRIDPEAIDEVLKAGLADRLGPARYDGILADFFSARWWRAGIEQILWEATDGQAYDINALRELTNGASRTDDDELVVTLNENLVPNMKLSRISDKVLELVRPIGWPSFSELPWMTADDRESAVNHLEPVGR